MVKFLNEIDDRVNQKVNEYLENHIKIHTLEKNQLKLEKDQLKNENEKLLENKNIKDLIEQRLYDKTDFSNPTEQGDYAEKIFDSIIRDDGLIQDDKARIEDTSDECGSGDRIITFSNGFVLMVEVKNKNEIKKSDIDEFESHYRTDFEKKKIDCALFFFLHENYLILMPLLPRVLMVQFLLP